MEIFQQFSTFKLPLDYEFDNHTTIYQDNEINDWIATISKINLDDSSSDLGICHNNPFIGVEYDFSKHEDYSTKNSTLTRWISYQNSHGKNYCKTQSTFLQILKLLMNRDTRIGPDSSRNYGQFMFLRYLFGIFNAQKEKET